jgi:glycosyltransferase involved in cell wall biosynthesis
MSSRRMSKLLYFSSSAVGGLADYAHEQANALAQVGVEVEMLTTTEHSRTPDAKYKVCAALVHSGSRPRPRIIQRLASARCIIKNFKMLDRQIREKGYKAVLLGSYSEYLAPLWSKSLHTLADSGVVFGAVCHDPVRDYVVGPLWWHRRSIAAGYSFLREAFVHEQIELDTVRPMPRLKTTVIPHGPYRFPEPNRSRAQVRRDWGVPGDAPVALSFGHIRDGKNLDLILRAMPDFARLHLVVAGKEQSGGQKPIAYYRDLAGKLGVENRCRWVYGHVPQEEVGNLFVGSDFFVLTYSRDFRSASGVLNAGVAYRKPCLASSGGGSLRSVVERYRLGWFIQPDSLPALKFGLAAALKGGIDPQWSTYESENSWGKNASLVKQRMFEHPA